MEAQSLFQKAEAHAQYKLIFNNKAWQSLVCVEGDFVYVENNLPSFSRKPQNLVSEIASKDKRPMCDNQGNAKDRYND